jgi:hypothetical protein
MTSALFFLRKVFWLNSLKILALLFVGAMIRLQIPELRYDLQPAKPVFITAQEEMTQERFSDSTFVSISGTADFDRAFIYSRYGLSYTYFNVKPYGMRLVVRTYNPVTDEWKDLNRFLGKLRPFNDQPFSYRIRAIFQDKYQAEIPEDAFFLGLEDIPKVSGWQIGAVIFAGTLWLVMFYMFFLFGRTKKTTDAASIKSACQKPAVDG